MSVKFGLVGRLRVFQQTTAVSTPPPPPSTPTRGFYSLLAFWLGGAGNK